MNTGDGNVMPNRLIDRSRSRGAVNIRGIRPQSSKAVRLTRWVRSSPAPPVT